MFNFFISTCVFLQIWPVYLEELNGLVVNLKIDSLPDPYKIDLSVSNSSNSRYQSRYFKILGGFEAPPQLFPFQAALHITLHDGTNTFCGGSIISQNYILTAAHCVKHAYSILVVLGVTDLGKKEAGEIRMYAKRYVYHAEYRHSNLVNDIALVYLPASIKYNDAIQPITLPSFDNVNLSFQNVDVTVLGWGKTTDFGFSPTKLQYLVTRVLSNSKCKLHFGSVRSTNVCTSGIGGIGSCFGDSGSPLIYSNKQIGIVSFGSKMCSAGLPSVYTRVTSYLSWIAANTDATISWKRIVQKKKARKLVNIPKKPKVFTINKNTTSKMYSNLSLK